MMDDLDYYSKIIEPGITLALRKAGSSQVHDPEQKFRIRYRSKSNNVGEAGAWDRVYDGEGGTMQFFKTLEYVKENR